MSKRKYEVHYSIDVGSKAWENVREAVIGHLLFRGYDIHMMSTSDMTSEGFTTFIRKGAGLKDKLYIHKNKAYTEFISWLDKEDFIWIKQHAPIIENVVEVKKGRK